MRPIKKGSTDQSCVIRIIDSTAGTPETTVEYDTAGIDLWWRREGETKTSITEAALAALDTAHADGGIEHIGDGYYRLDLPDAAVAAGSGENGVMIGGTVTGMIVIGTYIPLVDYDPYDTVRLGLTALPNAAADAAGGLPISDAGGLDLDTQIGTDIDAILVDTGTTLQGELDAIQAAVITNAAGVDIAADIIAVKAETALIVADTNELQTDDLPGKIVTLDAVVDTVKAETVLILADTADMQPRVAAIEIDTNELQGDWTNAGRLDVILDIIAADTTTDIPALIGTAQADLDLLTGADGATLATAQGNYTPNVVVPDVAGTAATQAELATAFTEIKGATWAAGTDTLEHIRNKQTDIETDTAEIGAAGVGLSAIPAVTLANGAHGGAAAAITLASYSDFTGAAAANPNVLQDGTITVTSQTIFVLSAGSADDDSYLNMVVVLEDASTATQKSVRTVTDYVGATKTMTINSAPDFTIVNTDNFSVLAVAPGSTPPTVEQVRAEMDSNSTQLAAIVLDTGTTLDTKINTIATDTTTDIPALIGTAQADLDTITGADGVTLATTQALYAPNVVVPATKAEMDSAHGLLATEAKQDIIDTNIDQIETAIITNAAGTDIAADIIAVKAETAAIVADTNELQTDDIPGKIVTLDAVVDTIKAETVLIVEDTGTTIPAAITSAHSTTDGKIDTVDNLLDTEIAALTTELGKVPKSDSTVSLNATALAAIGDSVLDEVMADLADNALNIGESITLRKAARGMFNRFFREVTQTATAQIVKNDSAAQIATMAVSDDATTQTKGTAT